MVCDWLNRVVNRNTARGYKLATKTPDKNKHGAKKAQRLVFWQMDELLRNGLLFSFGWLCMSWHSHTPV